MTITAKGHVHSMVASNVVVVGNDVQVTFSFEMDKMLTEFVTMYCSSDLAREYYMVGDPVLLTITPLRVKRT